MSRLTARRNRTVYIAAVSLESRNVSKDAKFDRCVVLSDDAFDPDAGFVDDIVDDDVLPCPELRVDDLTSANPGDPERFELHPGDAAENEEYRSAARLPATSIGPWQLDVYGREHSVWKKIRDYPGFCPVPWLRTSTFS